MNNNSVITNRSTSNQQQSTPQAPSALYNQQPNSQYTNYNNPNNFNNMVAAGQQGMDVGYNSQVCKSINSLQIIHLHVPSQLSYFF